MASAFIAWLKKKAIEIGYRILKKDGVEGVLKFLLQAIILPLLALIMLFAAPFLLFTNIPSVAMPTKDEKVIELQGEIYSKYTAVIPLIDEKNLEWIDRIKSKIGGKVDEFEIDYEYGLTVEHLLAIDSTIHNQDLIRMKNQFDKTLIKMGESLHKRTYSINEDIRIYYTIDDQGNKTKHEETVKIGKIKVETLDFNEMMTSLNFDYQEAFLAQNMYNYLTGGFNSGDLETFPSGSATIPYFSQKDERWANKPYDSSQTIRQGGCAPTSLSMIISGMTNRTVYPDEMANWARQNGYNCPNAGSYWSLMDSGARKWGLKVEGINKNNPNRILENLSKGNPIIMICSKGYFTTSGHFIVLYGLDENNKIMVHDPWSYEKSQETYDIGFMLNNASSKGSITFWAYSI